MEIRRLTNEQEDFFYEKYVQMKERGNYAGEILDKDTWRNNVEMYLNKHVPAEGNKRFSNTEIRHVSKLIARSDAWSDKQVASITNYLTKEFTDATDIKEQAKVINLLKEEFGEKTNLTRLVETKQGAVYQFLKQFSGNWNQYFNS